MQCENAHKTNKTKKSVSAGWLHDAVEISSSEETSFSEQVSGSGIMAFADKVEMNMKAEYSSDCIVVIPTYNEKENIEKIIRRVFELKKCFHILVVDDSSPDGTAGLVKALMANEFADRLYLIERSRKMGLGTAYLTGFKWCIQHRYDYIFEMDADFSHNPADLPRLYAACHDEGYDLAIGSRYLNGVNVVNWPMRRLLMSYFASKYVCLITGLKVHDVTSGFNCYRRSVLETIDLNAVRFKGYAFQIEMKFTVCQCGFKIKEIPIVFCNRLEGESKMNSSIFSEALFGVMRLRLDGWFKKYPVVSDKDLESGNAI